MKIFQTVQTNLKLIGIEANRTSFGLYEWKHIFGYILYILLLCVHIVYEAKTVKQHSESISKIVLVVFVLVGYLSYRYNSQAVFKIIDSLEQAINKSE